MEKYIITNIKKIYFFINKENVYKATCEGDAKWQNL